MKALNLILALSAPAMLAAGYMPESFNNQYISEVSSPARVFTDDNFRLPKQPYYSELFTKKELKKLAKAEIQRDKAIEGLVMAAAIKKQAEELKTASPEITSKIQKQITKLESKAIQQELNGLKAFEKAADIYRVVYTNELNNKTFSASTISEKTAQNLALEAQNFYQVADDIKDKTTSENMLESYRSMYVRLSDAISDQEIAFAIYKGDDKIDYTKYLNANSLDTTKTGNIAKEDIPALIANEHYDFDKDTNVYKLRIHQFEQKLKISDEDKTSIQKLEADESNSISLMMKAENLGCTADTFRVYAGEATTLAEKEYYEQKAQESELNECSNLLKAIKLEVASNNSLFAIYKKYIPAIRDEKNSVGKSYEEQADNLFSLSNTYENVAAKQVSHVEQYTQLSEGNEVKLQAIQAIENAIASYLGEPLAADQLSLASGASDKHNDIAMDFNMDESDGEPQKVANSAAPAAKPSGQAQKPAQPSANVVKPATPAKETTSAAKPATGKSSSSSSSKPKNTTAKTAAAKPAAAKTVAAGAREKQPAMASSNAAVVSTSYYTKDDQRMKPYTYPSGTIFSVEAGIYKEMPEPVEFPAVEKFLAQNLKGVTHLRYYIGTFQTYDAAYAALAMAKNEGYKKADVVAFVNGKKTDVATARKNAEKAANYQTLVQNELKQLNAKANTTTPVVVDKPVASNGQAIPLQELGGSTLYAVQISSVPTLLGMNAFNVNELYYDRNDAGLYRYYTGLSQDLNIATANLNTMRQSGYEDAYLIKVVNGKNSGAVNKSTAAELATVYRVQIGAYKAALSPQSKAQIDKLKSMGYPIHQSKSGEYTVYTVGDCGSRADADALRKELVAKGYNESYVVVFVNGVKQ